jgi:hypothetical protein
MIFDVIALVEIFESLYSAGGVHHFGFAGVKWMAFGTNFYPKIMTRSGSGNKLIATTTNYIDFFVRRMNICFHYITSLDEMGFNPKNKK